MLPSFIPVSSPLITAKDLEMVTQALSDGWISGEGPYIDLFENKMAEICDRKFAISVSNGTDALDLVFQGLNFEPGDEIILPSFTIISCLSQILRMGLVPVFVDADPVTWNMDVQQVEALISNKTRAILAVHIYGLAVDMDALSQIAGKHGIPIIEDAAEAHGLTFQGKMCGSFGLASTFSFYANKNITTGEGGMVLTDDEELANKLRSLKNLSHREGSRFVHDEIGWNMRISSLQAALGVSQLDRIHEIVARRREIAGIYSEHLDGLNGITIQPRYMQGAENAYWVYGLLLDESSEISVGQVQQRLQEKNIGTRPFFYPLHKQPVLTKYGFSSHNRLPVSELLGSNGFYIPNALSLENSQIEYIANSLKEVLRNK